MKLINKIRKADFSKKTNIWEAADMLGDEAKELVIEMILSLPGYYRIDGRDTCENLVDKVYEVYVAFTHGLDVVEIKK